MRRRSTDGALAYLTQETAEQTSLSCVLEIHSLALLACRLATNVRDLAGSWIS
jgi:hypothetical protein